MKRITDKGFKYTPSFNTDLRKSFRKYAQEQKEREERAKELEAETAAKVRKIASK